MVVMWAKTSTTTTTAMLYILLSFWTLNLFDSSFGAGINILWVNDDSFDVSTEPVFTAFQYLSRNPRNIINLTTIDSSRILSRKVANSEVCQTYNSMVDSRPPDLILDTSRSGFASHAVKALSRAFGTPTLSLTYDDKLENLEWEGLSAEEQKYLIKVQPPGEVISRILRQVVISKSIKSAAIIHDDSILLKSEYNNLFSNVPVIHTIERASSRIGSQLKRFSDKNLKSIFIVGTANFISSVADEAKRKNLFGPKLTWFVLTKDDEPSFSCDCGNGTVTYLRPMAANPAAISKLRKSTGLVSTPDLDMAFYYDTALRITQAVNMMKENGSWPKDSTFTKCINNSIIRTSTIKRTLDLLDAFKTVNVQPTFGPLVFPRNLKNFMKFSVEISELQFKDGKLQKILPVASWQSDNSGVISAKANATFALIVQNIPTYRVVIVVQPPFIYKTIDSKNGTANYFGYCIDLINELASMMNFKYELYEAPGNSYGFPNKTGHWNGLVRELADKNADIGLGAVAMMAERERVLDFTFPFYEGVGFLLLMKKIYLEPSLFRFLEVLDDLVWVLICLAYCVNSVIIYILDRFSPYSYQNNKKLYQDETEKRVFDLRESFWFSIISLVPQGGGQGPRNVSGKIAATFWWAFVFISVASYVANLAAILTVSRLQTDIGSFDDLTHQYLTRYSPVNGSATMLHYQRLGHVENVLSDAWENMTLDLNANRYDLSRIAAYEYPASDKMKKVYKFMVETGFPNSTEQAIYLIRNPMYKEGAGKYAFVGDASDVRFAEMTNCDLKVVGKEFSKKSLALAVQSGSPLKRELDYNILKLHNDRKLDVLKYKWWDANPDRVDCPELPGDDFDGAISIYNIGGLFIIASVGVVTALLVLAVEYFYYRGKLPANANRSETGLSIKIRRKEAEVIVDN